MILSKTRIAKALISLHGCTGWSAPLLFSNPEDSFFVSRPICAYSVLAVPDNTSGQNIYIEISNNDSRLMSIKSRKIWAKFYRN